jgi:serine phosphatase RsbU (regulator of sigma subunit)
VRAEPPDPISHDHYLRLHAVNVYVRDQERSLRFFLDKLGFQVAFDAHVQSGHRQIAVSPPDGSAVLALIQPEPNTAQYRLIGRSTQVVFVTEDVPATYREWRARGVRFRHTPRLRRVLYQPVAAQAETGESSQSADSHAPAWGGVFTRFEDIDRNTFALVSFDEVSRAVEAQRRATAEKLEAERRAAQELEIARQVQARLFPQTLPPLESLEYAGACVQTRKVGGDYYDFLDLGDQRIGIALADIAGKGVAAALLMAVVQASLRIVAAEKGLSLPELAARMNGLLHRSTNSNSYATFFYAQLDERSRQLRYVNAGHNPPYLVRPLDGQPRPDAAPEIRELSVGGTVIGLFPQMSYEEATIDLRSGDVLVAFTDGVTEALNAAEEEYGEERLKDLLRGIVHLPAPEISTRISEGLRGWIKDTAQYDDLTFVVMKVN